MGHITRSGWGMEVVEEGYGLGSVYGYRDMGVAVSVCGLEEGYGC